MKRRCESRRMTRGQMEMARERTQSAFFRPPRTPMSVSMREVVDDLTRDIGLGEATTLNRIKTAWIEIAGPQIADNSAPGDLVNGTLVVHVTHPIWMVQLQQFGRQEILRRVKARFPEENIRDIRIRLHHDAE